MMEVKWNDIRLGLPPFEGKYIVYRHFPYTDQYEIAIETFKAKFKIDYTEDNKQMMYKKFKFEKRGVDPQVVRAWMFMPDNPKLPS